MGEVAELILEGVLCENCGCLMEDLIPGDGSDQLLEPPGYPRKCTSCLNECRKIPKER